MLNNSVYIPSIPIMGLSHWVEGAGLHALLVLSWKPRTAYLRIDPDENLAIYELSIHKHSKSQTFIIANFRYRQLASTNFRLQTADYELSWTPIFCLLPSHFLSHSLLPILSYNLLSHLFSFQSSPPSSLIDRQRQSDSFLLFSSLSLLLHPSSLHVSAFS